MDIVKTVRFSLKDLLLSVRAQRVTKRRLSVGEALDRYTAWAMSRGWRLLGLSALKSLDQMALVKVEREERETLICDEIYTMLWKGTSDCETPDYLEAFPVRDLTRFCDYLESNGWELCDDRDGYQNSELYISGDQLNDLREDELLGDWSALIRQLAKY